MKFSNEKPYNMKKYKDICRFIKSENRHTEAGMNAAIDLQLLMERLNRISPLVLSIFICHFFRGMSNFQIAVENHLSEKFVYTALINSINTAWLFLLDYHQELA